MKKVSSFVSPGLVAAVTVKSVIKSNFSILFSIYLALITTLHPTDYGLFILLSSDIESSIGYCCRK